VGCDAAPSSRGAAPNDCLISHSSLLGDGWCIVGGARSYFLDTWDLTCGGHVGAFQHHLTLLSTAPVLSGYNVQMVQSSQNRSANSQVIASDEFVTKCRVRWRNAW
jgi:hypothetical protein